MNALSFAVLPILAPLFFAACTDNKYAGTAQQAGVMHLQLKGKGVAHGVVSYQRATGEWPPDLAAVIASGELTEESILYPKIFELPDRRDILKMSDHVEWIYIRPVEGSEDLPLIVAPLPYTKSMSNELDEPRRIVVNADTIPSIIDETEFAAILKRTTGG